MTLSTSPSVVGRTASSAEALDTRETVKAGDPAEPLAMEIPCTAGFPLGAMSAIPGDCYLASVCSVGRHWDC